MFVAVSHLHTSLTFADKPGAYQSVPFTELHSKVMLLDLSTNIRQEGMWLEVTNPLAYYDKELNCDLKSFIALG
jgi:hypothetical protein